MRKRIGPRVKRLGLMTGSGMAGRSSSSLAWTAHVDAELVGQRLQAASGSRTILRGTWNRAWHENKCILNE